MYGCDVRTHQSVGPVGQCRLVPMGKQCDPFTGLSLAEMANRKAEWVPDRQARVRILNAVLVDGVGWETPTA